MKSGIGELIGNTPVVQLKYPELPDHVTLFAKLEGNNPGGSVKDRPAYNMISEALRRGDINLSTKLVEATSGNTGIALAMVAAALKMNLTLIMPENSTQERIDTMRAYGAKVILTDAQGTIEYSRTLADKMVDEEGYYTLNQFANEDNFMAHYKTTGPEVWQQTQGKITHFVASMGTTGTIMGNSLFLKEKNPNIKVIGVQPKEGSQIPGIRKWSPEFLPAIYKPERVDEILYVSRDEARKTTQRLAEDFGLFAGMSSGGVQHALVEYFRGAEEPAVVVSIVCDRGDRYLSSDLFVS